MSYTVTRRTFEAKQHPKDSDERRRLNCNPITSEYMPSYKYVLCEDGKPTPFTYRTKAEAERKATP